MISIFAKEPMRLGRDKHLGRVSSIIRGHQIAEQIGAKLNPTSGYEKDVCIYVKPHVPVGYDFNFEGKAYMDIVDGWGLIPLMRNHKEVPVIACSKQDHQILSGILDNKMILIPQHHCNYDRVERDRTEVKTVGMIGTIGAYQFLPEGFEEKLKEMGMEFIGFSKFNTRQDIIDFYKKVDVQIVWRPYRMRLSNPLKLVNASSFGIPTIAFDETVFKEMEGCYIPVRTIEDFFANLEKLRSDFHLYENYSKRCLEKSEEYHIEKIGKLYLEL